MTDRIDAIGLKTFFPSVDVRRRWSDRWKVVTVPLFPGYTFAQAEPERVVNINSLGGVVGVVGGPRGPIPVCEAELSNIRSLVESGQPFEAYPDLAVGKAVRVRSGPLQGLRGTLIRWKGSEVVVVSMDLLQRGAVVHIPTYLLEVMG